jgi:hypothetical protein
MMSGADGNSLAESHGISVSAGDGGETGDGIIIDRSGEPALRTSKRFTIGLSSRYRLAFELLFSGFPPKTVWECSFHSLLSIFGNSNGFSTIALVRRCAEDIRN